MGRTSGFRECLLTLRDARRNLSPVRRREPTEPQASAERYERGKPEGKPQGRTGGSRENAARRDRGKGANPARGARPEWVRGSVLRWSVVRRGGFPGVAVAGPGRGCPTRPRHGASGSSLTWPRGAREASAERLLGVASRPGTCSPLFRSPCTGNDGEGRFARPRIGSVSLRRDLAQERPEAGWALACGHLAVELLLDQREVVGMGHPDTASFGRQHRERAGGE